jgi:hypothetical protein
VAPARGRTHRLHRPPPPLARSLSVDEQEWSVRPSQVAVAAGPVRVTVYDRGQDDHNLVIQGPDGVTKGFVSLIPGQSSTIVAHLPPGTYHLFCSLYAGTPQSHEALGMHALLTVR